jgi:hypothetical protein
MFTNGQGLWPAFWMMPQSYGANGMYGAWPASGEIDIAEVSTKPAVHFCITVVTMKFFITVALCCTTKPCCSKLHSLLVKLAVSVIAIQLAMVLSITY